MILNLLVDGLLPDHSALDLHGVQFRRRNTRRVLPDEA